MECNKDEAIRAKQLAEKKLTEKDISGAKRFAVKAQSLFPGLDGLSQFQEILDVYSSSQKKVNGEVDWYEIFGVDPLADNETIKKKYRKLALALHPDKNKSVGADGAFKIISEAWSLLSDKAKRDAYNERRNIRAPYQRARDGNPPTGPGKSTSKNFSRSSSKPRNPTAQEKFQQDTKTSYKKGKGKTLPNNAGKGRCNSFTNSSSTTNQATHGKPQQETRPSYEKDGGASTLNPATQGKPQQETRPSYEKDGGASTLNPATQGKPQQQTRPSYEKDRGASTINPATQGKSQQNARSSYEKDRGGNSTSFAGKSSSGNFTGSSSSKKHPATPDDVQQDTRTSYQKATNRDIPVGDGRSGYNTFSNGAFANRNVATSKNSHTMPSAPCGVNCSKTFWTSCKACNMQYEYVNIYRNKKLLCPTCRKPFMAREMPPPRSMGKKPSAKVPCRQKQQGLNHNSFDTSSNSGRKSMGASGYSSFKSMGRKDIPPVSPSKCDGARSESRPVTSAGQTAQNFQSTNVNLKRQHEQEVDVAVNVAMHGKKRTAPVIPGSDTGLNFAKGEMAAKKRRINEQMSGVGGSGSQKDVSGRGNIDTLESKKNSCFRDMSKLQTRYMLMFEAKTVILQKMRELGTRSSGEACEDMVKKNKNVNTSEEMVVCGMQNLEKVNTVTNSDTEAKKTFAMTVPVPGQLKECSLSAVVVDSDWMPTESMSKIVPDSDFINFDKDRTKESFAEDQVWAAYDDEGMPRLYALVQSLISFHQWKVKISWLNSRNSTDLGNLTWVNCRFGKTFGDFRIRRHKVDVAVDSFSHRVKYKRSDGDIIEIFPRKGDVWALYRNWSSDWNELTPDDVIRKYEMVEVLDDYNEHNGVLVVPLVKVAGFKSVFHKHLNLRKVYTIPREEMFRFSHQVPSHLITGCEKKAPKGCRELDPAAIPEELLQVIIESEEEELESMLNLEGDGRKEKFEKDE